MMMFKNVYTYLQSSDRYINLRKILKTYKNFNQLQYKNKIINNKNS